MRSIGGGLVVGAFIGLAQYFVYESDQEAWAIALLVLYDGALFFFYLGLLFLPQRIIHRRPAVRLYAWYWVLSLPVSIVTYVLMYTNTDAGYCLYVAFSLGLFGLPRPWVLLYTLRQDSQYWQVSTPAACRCLSSCSFCGRTDYLY
jgi:hypothetical protein